jgi:4-amino-4-deoxy-L-arabinose transferase-like glycosyltransferase
VISLSWVVAVDMVDEDDRPYIGSSETNSAVELVLGHNGLSRFLGRGQANSILLQDDYDDAQSGQLPPANNQYAADADNRPNPPNRRPPQSGKNAPANGNAVARTQGQGSGITGEAGDTSILRLFNEKNSGQVSWFLLPAVLMALASFVMLFIKKFRTDKKFPIFFLFSMWLIPMYVYFSYAQGITHRYYFAMLGPGIAALIGMGYYILSKAKNRMLIPSVFVLTASAELYIHSLYIGWMDWIIPVCGIIFAGALIAMIIMAAKKIKPNIIAILMSVLILIPAVWAASPVIYSDNSQLPIAGPELINQRDSFDNAKDLSGIIDYLADNRNGATYIAMAESSMQNGAELILQSGEAVMVLGGFNGGDETVTLQEFIELIKNNEVKYAVISQNRAQSGNQQIFMWIKNNCKIVSPSEYGGAVGNLRVYYLGK